LNLRPEEKKIRKLKALLLRLYRNRLRQNLKSKIILNKYMKKC
jgi:hypothetical protein